MQTGLIRTRLRIAALQRWLRQSSRILGSRWLDPLTFIVISFAMIPLGLLKWVLEIPYHLRHSTMDGFSNVAARGEHGEFLESYSSYLHRARMTIATFMLAAVAVSAQFFALGYSAWTLLHPHEAEAYSSSVTLNPSWDITAHELTEYPDDGSCVPSFQAYDCASVSSTTLERGRTDPVGACDFGVIQDIDRYHPIVKFDLSSIPNNATITDVSLTVNVTATTSTGGPIYKLGTTTPDNNYATTCTDGSLFAATEGGTQYVGNVNNWTSTGSKTYDLGSSADSDVQTAITGGDVFAISLGTNILASTVGSMSSTDAASNKPQLVVSYTLPPQAPTGFAHTGNATGTINWGWTDNATVETRYDVNSGSSGGTPVTGCTNLAANSTSCTETGLSANTQYTRHAKVTDANGTSESSAASAYTSIESPAGLSFSSITTTGLTAASSTTLSNLSSGSSGVWFQESVTSTNSGWLTTNSWAKSGLTANTQYSFQAKARNGDTDETALTSAATKYTLSATPNVTSSRSTSMWYNTNPFPFTNAAGWGSGGVQYYRYVWDQTITHTFTGSENTWSNLNANCPGGTCSDTGTTLNKTATADGNNWYLHVQSFNGDQTANGSGTDYGPYYYDATAPTAPATVNDGTGADATYQTSTTTISANWTAASDATSGLQKYQYAIGTTSGGTQVLGYTDNGTATTVTNSSLSLTNGQTYYVSVRAVDNASNTGSATASNGVTISTSSPTVTDNQTGDTTPRNAAGTTYNVDFAKASTGPNLDYAQYTVYSGANKTGTLLKDWTNIFTTDVASYTTDWAVDFSALQEGTNYVSVKAVALDALSTEVDDVFTILKDTVAPVISSVSASPSQTSATVTWSTNESASSQVEYGLTASYGQTTPLDSSLVTSHSVSISGLTASTTYHVRAISSDEAGNQSLGSDVTFTTTAAPVTATTISNVVITATSSTATITWTTNHAATSVVRYGTSSAYGQTESDASAVTSHSVTISGLAASTTYHYQVESVGNTTVNTSDDTFTTAENTTPTPSSSSVAAPTLDTPYLPTSSSGQLTAIGRARGGLTVVFRLDGQIVGVKHVSGLSSKTYPFTLKVSVGTLSVGEHRLTARAHNSVGGLSTITTQYIIVKRRSGVVNVKPGGKYIVQSGDSLWSIAQQFYGDGNQYNVLMFANAGAHPELLTNPSLIQPGWTLTIPAI